MVLLVMNESQQASSFKAALRVLKPELWCVNSIRQEIPFVASK
jgi:hypothetical protein